MYTFLKDPQLYLPWTIQPNYGLSDQQARELTAYLMTLKGEKKPAEKITSPPQANNKGRASREG